ncbi:MAG TPA: condensation domain-containing protein, partial [Thermoanaerobaculia bacterium]|nr:condensation domain-containing protein [Thermoanaerobaculia bacterium]
RAGRSHPRPDLSVPYVAPRDEREEALAAIFREVLALDRVGVEDSFFELGGDSVIALQVIARAQRAGLPLTPNDLFSNPTIGALARPGGAEAKALPALVPRGGHSSPLPLSLNQERYWARYRRGGPSASLNLPIAVGFEGDLDVSALEVSLQTIFDRHEALRTVFREGESGAVQVVLPPFPVPVARVDLSALPAGRRADEARRISDAVGSYVFDLERELLFLLVLVHLEEREHRLVTVKHHLITDGWSGGLFAQELAELYGAAVRGEEPQLPALPVQYGDFALWQREHFRREGLLAEHMEYWRTTLSHGDFPVLRLPGDHPRRSGGGFVGLEEVRLLPKELVDGLGELARRENATLFMALLSAVNVLLYSRTGLADLALTTDLANRGQIEIEKLIGLFTNVVVLRSHLDGDPSFREMLARAKRVTLESFAHQDLPFAELMADLKAGWLESYHEVFPVAFVFQNYPGREFALPGLALSAVEIEPGAVSRDLLMVLGETPRGVRVMFRYRSDYFRPETVRRMVDDLSALIESIVRDPDQSLSALVEGIGAVVPGVPENVVCEPVGGLP